MTDSGTAPQTPARLVELAVDDFGIIDHLALVLEPAMTALTGETGAGKTMVVGAIDLLLGGRADSTMVRAGATEALVQGRFDVDGEELVLTRVVPADGRSRAYVNGRMATAAVLAERTGSLLDLHGQHGHQTLLSTRTQRHALDRYAGVDLGPLEQVRAEITRVEADLAPMGGDAGARAREADLLRFQLAELDAAGLDDPAEDEVLDGQETVLADAVGHRDAIARAAALLDDDAGALGGISSAIAALDGRGPLVDHAERLRAVQAEVSDLNTALRDQIEQIEDDPERLAELRDRRQLLVDLRRKYASASLEGADTTPRTGASLADVMTYRDAVAERLDQLDHHDVTAAELEDHLAELRRSEATAAATVGASRRGAADQLARATEAHLADLAMAKARLSVEVGVADPGDDVAFLLAANPPMPAAPLAKVASGGELARTMLALRLVLSEGPPILVFDEVDAGIGGEAALAVGRSLARLGRDRQVLVVTHLPQVAAFADHQVHVAKSEVDGSVSAAARRLDHSERVVELSRMLSGTPDSARMRQAAKELLATAEEQRKPA